MTSEDIEALYDAHAARLYALALRITGDAATAAAAVEAAFVGLWESADEQREDDFRMLVRLTRQSALARKQGQTGARDVGNKGVTPAGLIEELFFGGLTLRELAGRYGLGETQVRRMICDGMAALRMQMARQGTT